jgi:uncharacterized damage-inducible protein DinB
MTADEARTLIQYSGWASKKVLEAVQKLPPEDRDRENGVSHTSIGGTASHIFLADRIWYQRTMASTDPVVWDATFAQTEIEWPALQAKWEAWAQALTDADTDRVIEYKLLNGNPGASQVKQIVTHLVNHATLHRGQIVGMIRQLGIQPPATDILWYYREQGQKF